MLPFCYLDEELGAFTLPSAEEILARRAVVVTCGAAGLLREAYVPAGQPMTGSELPITFTHVLIDEAGQVRSAYLFKGQLCRTTSIVSHHARLRLHIMGFLSSLHSIIKQMGDYLPL